MNIENLPLLIIEKVYNFIFNPINNTKEENKNLCLVSKNSYNLIKQNDKNIDNIMLNSKICKSYNDLKHNIKNFNVIDLYKLKFGTCVIRYIYNIFRSSDHIFLTEKYIGSAIKYILHDKRINNILFKKFFLICHFEVNFKARYNIKKENFVFSNKSKYYQEKANRILDILKINKHIEIKTINEYISFIENFSIKELFYLCYVHKSRQGYYNFEFLKI